ncbi:MAG: type II secretion system F family protein, partial [Culturomica sp.]|nr:type II secretion system F family protein [Culturomica sp.]
IGEETGRLDESLQFLSDYYRKQIERRRMVKGAVSYPLVILSVAVAVLVFMLTVIVPMFEQVYGRMGGELPGITRAIITFSGRFPLLLAVTGGALLLGSGAVMLWGRNDDFRLFRGRLLLRLPLAGNLLRKNYEVQFCKLLYLLCSSGIPLLKSITMLEEIITFPPYRFSFRSIARGLQQGELFADNLACFQQLYDRRLIALLRVGEETNRLPEMLRKQGDSLTAELEHRIRQLGNLMEPVLILGIGGIVAFVLISMYLPMFKLGGVVG